MAYKGHCKQYIQSTDAGGDSMREKFIMAVLFNRDTFNFKGMQYIVIDDCTAYQYDSDTVYYKDIDF